MRYVLAVLGAGCAGVDATGVDSAADGQGSPEDSCRGAVMEADFGIDPELGPAGDPANWGPLPPDAIVATTYLQMQPTAEAEQAFYDAGGPIQAVLPTAAGLMGLSFAGSDACGTLRTLSVWASEADMMAFVTGPEHGAAMGRIGEISRGSSMTMHWTVAELGEVSWEAVIAGLAEHDGPLY